MTIIPSFQLNFFVFLHINIVATRSAGFTLGATSWCNPADRTFA